MNLLPRNSKCNIPTFCTHTLYTTLCSSIALWPWYTIYRIQKPLRFYTLCPSSSDSKIENKIHSFLENGSVSVLRKKKYIPKYHQKDATLHSSFISVNCSTCFRWIPAHHQEGALHCIYSIWYLSNRYCYLPLPWKSWNSSSFNSSMVATNNSNGLTNTRCCRYSAVLLPDDGWGIHPKHVE